MGLNPKFGTARSNILSPKSIPSSSKDACHRHMRQELKLQPSQLKLTGAGVKIVGFQGAGRGRPTCDHRGNIGHLESSCWELHGVLDWAEQRGRKGASNPTPVAQFRGATGRQTVADQNKQNRPNLPNHTVARATISPFPNPVLGLYE